MKKIFILIAAIMPVLSVGAQSVTLAWDKIDTSGFWSEINALTVLDNDIYATGIRESAVNTDDVIVLKYTSAGNLTWQDNFGYPEIAWKNNRNEGHIIKATPAGNLLVGANTRKLGDRFEIKSYSPAGGLNLTINSDQYTLTSNAFGYLADFTILPNGDIAVFAGLNYSDGLGMSYTVLKLTSSGSYIWGGKFSSSSAHDYPRRIRHDSSGILYITGGVFTFSNGTYDFTTLNLYGHGLNDWISRFNHSAGFDDFPIDMTVDADKNQFITGVSEASPDVTDMSTIRLNEYGTRLWTDIYAGSGQLNDTAVGVVTDGTQNAIVVGTTIEDTLNATLSTITVIKYDGGGNRVWVKSFTGSGNLGGKAKAITIDGNNTVYVLGEVQSSTGGSDIFIAALDPSGQVIWSYEYNGVANQDDFASSIALDGNNDVIIGGATMVGGKQKHLVFKLNQPTSGTGGVSTTGISSLEIKSTWYSSNNLKIKYTAQQEEEIDMAVIDMAGRVLFAGAKNIYGTSGTIEIPLALSAGVYLVHINTQTGISVAKKFVVID